MTDNDRQAPDLDDETLRGLLTAALQQSDPVPHHVVAAAGGAWTWRTIDQELADLVFDSATELTGVRDRESARQLTFRAQGLEIEVMVADAASRRLVGQLVPAQTTTVRLEGAETSLEQQSDRFGRFTFDGAPAGPLRFAVTPSDGSTVTTDWVLL
jgi:hypothetical protein